MITLVNRTLVCVSIRFYAYRPIRPGQPDTGSDSGVGVTPEALWLGLLWQIRDNLRKTHLLAEFHVPVWLDGMCWEIAREHVLRIATALGNRWNRDFIICIDGIDHAARAQRKGLPEFLKTLPSPDDIPPNVRFLFAGQPPDAYPEYPFFLRQAHLAVEVHPLDILEDEDLRMLWCAAEAVIPRQADEVIVRKLAEKGQRRTLPTVYAVEDIRTSRTLGEAIHILDARPLADSLHNYYDTIWSSAMGSADETLRLAAVFAILRERPTGEMMALVFSDLGKSTMEWSAVMRRLRPLVRETSQGFELVHNDLRVHLDARFSSEPFLQRDISSALANYYRSPSCSRLAAHTSLLDLLTVAGRQEDFADDFTVDWVIEAGAIDFAGDDLAKECGVAFAGAVARRDWLLLHAVACASLTLHRIQECQTNWVTDVDPVQLKVAPTFLPVEGEPLPLELWSGNALSELVTSCQLLVDCGEVQRASLVLEQWLGGMSQEDLIRNLTRRKKRQLEGIGDGAVNNSDLEKLGLLYATCGLPLLSSGPATKENSVCRGAIECGWVRGLAQKSLRREALRRWCVHQPKYMDPWIATVKEAAARCRWGEVSALLNRFARNVDKLDPDVLLEFGWYAARAKPRNSGLWQKPLSLPNFGLAVGSLSLKALLRLARWITYSDLQREPAQVAEDLMPLLDQNRFDAEHHTGVGLVLRASAIQGRIFRYLDSNQSDVAALAVSDETLKQLLEVLWCKRPDVNSMPHEEYSTPGEVGVLLADAAWECRGSYRTIVCGVAKERFPGTMLWSEGKRLFDILCECGELKFLEITVTVKVHEIIENLHNDDVASRNGIVENLLHFTNRLKMEKFSVQLAERLRWTRIGYGSHNEWIFQPLVRWFEILRKSSPEVWKLEGRQLLSLDLICEQQSGDNSCSEQIIAQVAAAAMTCGPDDFEALFGLLRDRDTKYPLSDLANASKGGFEICLRETDPVSDESVLARIAVAISVGRWPSESAMTTVRNLMTSKELRKPLAHHPAWEKALRVAADMQGNPEEEGLESTDASDVLQIEAGKLESAEAILQQIIETQDSSWVRLGNLARLAEQAHAETHPNRDELMAKALAVFESSSATGRTIEIDDSVLMTRLFRSLTESERWRLLGIITSITSEMRGGLHDANWAFRASFSAVDLICCARAADVGREEFSGLAFHQLIETHWKWHGIPAPLSYVSVGSASGSWSHASLRILLSLMQTDACETVYMAMSGLRFYADIFPEEIPLICEEGLSDKFAKDAILALGQLWATRQPEAFAPALEYFSLGDGTTTLDDRLNAWVAISLHRIVSGGSPRSFSIPSRTEFPEIVFPGDGSLLKGEVQKHGLVRHNTFFDMVNERMKRAGIILGPMESGIRYISRKFKEGAIDVPPMMLPKPRKLSFDSLSPRPSCKAEHVVGDAIAHQCAGQSWSPADASALRLVIGYGLDPWIASATPNKWRINDSWPSEYNIEKWLDGGARKSGDVFLGLSNLIEGHDLDPPMLLLGSVLHCPTFRRDLLFRYWLENPEAEMEADTGKATWTPAGRTLSGWLAGWSFATPQSDDATSVHFVGNLVNYPNCDMEITPTDMWMDSWGWQPDPKNALQFLTENGTRAAWYERWLGPDSHTNRICRQPLLSRWVCRRDALPLDVAELNHWTRQTRSKSGLLPKPE